MIHSLGRRRLLGLGVLSALPAALTVSPVLLRADAHSLVDSVKDFAVEGGRHYTQGFAGSGAGYDVRNRGLARWWDAFRRLGGAEILGHPLSRPFAAGGFEYQLFRYGLLQWWVASSRLVPANVMEVIDEAGYTGWLLDARNVPRPVEDDGSQSYSDAVRIRIGWLENEAIRGAFHANLAPVNRLTWTLTDSLQRWGLPMSRPVRLGPFVAQRFQRGVLQHWIDDVPNLPESGSVTQVPVGELLRDVGVVPRRALVPVESAQAFLDATGRTIGSRLQAAVVARLAGEPGKWSVYAAPMGSPVPEIAVDVDVVVSAASLWKLVLLVESFRQRAVAGLDFRAQLEMTQDVVERVDPPASLAPGQRITIESALEKSMTISDNTTAVLLGDHLGYFNMARTLEELSLVETDVVTRHPLTTARETAMLLEVAVGARPANWERTMADVLAMRGLLLRETRNQRIPARLPVGTSVAHKTGDLVGVSNDAGVVYASTGPFTLVILAHSVPLPVRAANTAADIASMVMGAYDPQMMHGPAPVG